MKRFAISFGLLFAMTVYAERPLYASEPIIVFCSDRDGDNEIYTMKADGSNVVQITFNDTEEYAAMSSPDGRRIAFTTERDGNQEIYVINVDGTELQRLTDNQAIDQHPKWSRDGMRIVFVSDRDGDKEIYTMDPDGGGVEQVTYNTALDNSPSWSPDGSRIACHSDRSGPADVWVMNADGSAAQNLTDNSPGDWMPEWSPDGSEIVFESDRHGPLELYIMNPDGSGVRRLTYMFSDNHEPDWKPDGSQIMFSSFQGGDYDVMVINPDGTSLQNLTNNTVVNDGSPSWCPEVIDETVNGGGTGLLAYCNQPVSAPDVHEIYTIHIDGTQKRQLIESAIGLNHHEWSPDGQQIAAVGYVDANTWSIYTADADGGNLMRRTAQAGVWDNEPSWSPDGTRLAWGRIYPAEGYRAEIWVMNADGGAQHTIGVEGDGVRWSPDGTRLIYFKELTGVDIWTCDIDGGNEHQLTASAGDNMTPDWSPDGSKVVFVSTRDGNHEIYIMNSDGTAQRRLTDNSEYDGTPTWSPDGSLIAFGRDVTGGNRWEVCVMDSSGANVRRVTYSPPDRTAINPDWQPADSSRVPVYLVFLMSKKTGNSVTLLWEVAKDATAADFRLVAEQGGGRRDVRVAAIGIRRFEAVDSDIKPLAGGSVVYNLLGSDDEGGWDLLGRETVVIAPPTAAAKLTGVCPNPFNPRTTISFVVNTHQHVTIAIYDVAGRRVATAADRTYPAGDYDVVWDGRDAAGREVASGTYFLRFEAGKITESQKLVLVR